jgi:uncharacterized repeat protein (TIGR01451 family)
MEKQDRGTGVAGFLSLKYGRWIVGALLAACLGNAAAQTVRWEDYRGNSRVGTTYTGPAGAPTFANNTGTGADRLNALRAIAANPANAVRTGTAADINYRQAANHLCNLDSAATSVASCNLQAMGRVSYALVQFPAAGTYTVSIAHDDNVELGFSSDYANTSYRTASYDVPVGTVNDWTANEDTYVSLGSFTAANANSCALVRMYWLNHGGINHARLRWTLPGSGSPVIIPSTAFRDPAAAASATGCNGSITGNGTTITLNKVLGALRADATDQFTVQIGTTSTAGTVREATTSGTGVGQQASTGALAVTTGTTYYLRDTMAAGSASTLAGAYTASINCTRNGTAFTPAGTSPTWNVTPVANDQIVCAVTNTARPRSDLSIIKAANPTTALSGSVVTYTVTASNPGPSAANSTVIRDTPGVGLDCTDPVATAACAASGGASCPGTTVPVASLTGTGVTIPVFPVGGQIVLTLQCRVTATGLTP